MFGGALCVSLATKIRTLEPVLANKDRAQFIIGTSTLNQPNQIFLVEVNDDASHVLTRKVFRHPGEVLCLAPSPQDSHLLLTCGKQRSHPSKAFLWNTEKATSCIEEDREESETITAAAAKDLTLVATFPEQKQPVSEYASRTLNYALQRLQDRADLCELSGCIDFHGMRRQTRQCWHQLMRHYYARGNYMEDTTKRGAKALTWDPHHASRLAFAVGGALRTWDIRAKHDIVSVVDAHLSATLSLDFNPNKPYTVVSGGDDGKINFWDLRHACKPILTLNAHSHWVWSTRFHPQYDQLVLSGGSDATSALWRVSSISSSPLVELDERDLMDEAASGAAVTDTLIGRVEDHENTVFAGRWAAGGDSWMFASVSYDGRLAINHVPSAEKYKILL